MKNAIKIITFYLGVLILFSCTQKENYLKKAILHNAVICTLIHSDNSEIILITTPAKDLIEELDLENSEEYIYESILNRISIKVSNDFYNKNLSSRIHQDSIMSHTYKEQGVKGLIKNYFKESSDNSFLILSNTQEMFPIQGELPYPAFGQETNSNYMIYLLSQHDIYLTYFWMSEGGILFLWISKNLSDEKELRKE